MVAFALAFLVGLMAFVVDAGYWFSEKNHRQNALEAAALGGALHLCDPDTETVARQLTTANGLAEVDTRLEVTRGFYDDRDRYGHFKRFQEFVPSGDEDFPGEYTNALLVRYRHTDKGLTGLSRPATLTAEAVAYLKRYGLVSLDPEGEIQIGPNSTWAHGGIYAAGDIKLSRDAVCTSGGWWGTQTEIFEAPRFADADLYSEGRVLACPLDCHPTVATSSQVDWDNCQAADAGYAVPAGGEIHMAACDDGYVEALGNRTAGLVLTPGDAGSNPILSIQLVLDTTYYVFDLTESRSRRETIFFDIEDRDKETHIVKIASNHEYATAIKRLTFICNADVHLQNDAHRGPQDWGGEGDDQLVIITSASVQVSGGRATTRGVVFRCGGYFYLEPGATHFVSGEERIRVIADKSIYLYGGEGNGAMDTSYVNDLGKWSADTDFHFGPPCPPAIVKLGRLVPTDQ